MAFHSHTTSQYGLEIACKMDETENADGLSETTIEFTLYLISNRRTSCHVPLINKTFES